jgi:hypothetical protein
MASSTPANSPANRWASTQTPPLPPEEVGEGISIGAYLQPSSSHLFKQVMELEWVPETRFARRFRRLGIANLLRLQLEIHKLEISLKTLNLSTFDYDNLFTRLNVTLRMGGSDQLHG